MKKKIVLGILIVKTCSCIDLYVFKKKRNFPYQSQLHTLTVPIVKLDIMMLISWNPPFWHHNSFLSSLHLLTYLYTTPIKHHCLYCTFSLTLLFVFLEDSIFRPDLPPVCYSLHFCRYWQNGVLKFFHRCCCNCFPMHTCIEDKIIRNHTFPIILGFGQIKLKQHLMPILKQKWQKMAGFPTFYYICK